MNTIATINEIGHRLSAEAATAEAAADSGAWLAALDVTDPETAPLDAVLELAGSAPSPYWAGFMAGQTALRLRRGQR